MQFEELKKELKSCGFETIRNEAVDYLEVVVIKKHLPALSAKLSSIFGPPAWPSDGKLSNEVHGKIKNFGGIMQGQTLFFTHMEGSAVFVMLWPWSDGEHTTVKIGKQ